MSTKINKDLHEICKEKGITTYGGVASLIQGRKLKVSLPTGKIASGHNYKKKIIADKTLSWSNNTATIPPSNCVIGNGAAFPFVKPEYGGTSIYLHELFYDEITIDDLKEELTQITDKFKTEESDLKDKIAVMEELGLTEYDEKFIKIVKAMGNLEFKKGSDMDKVKLATLLMETF